ncbi:site-specific integrase [Trichocoleus desertorum AS-A10]|uniref:site-specific integrase n=1 Tax=Trichocoleus desertorum TaxID=1481672 RepID=UPI003296E616
MSSDRINQANGRLRAAKVGVTIQQLGNRLYLKATFPPKPGSAKTHPHQQRIALGIHANPAGVSLAEKEARKVGALLDCRQFDWTPYLKVEPQQRDKIGDWIERFEIDYFTRRARNPKSETTWHSDYWKVFKTLPLDQPLTVEVLTNTITSVKADSRTRKRFVDVLSRLAEFAELEANFKPLKGSYSSKNVAPRDLPSDQAIAQLFYSLKPGPWQWAFGMMAAYGLRNHELFYCDLSRFPILQITEGAKTDPHRVWPLYPEWAEKWELQAINLPNCTGKNNTDLGNRVTHAFKRMGIPFPPYNLRHAWAVRAIEFRLDVSLAAAQMGHSVKIHCEIYQHWINEDVHQRAYDALITRADRPKVPLA